MPKPDFDDSELWVIRVTLKGRYGEEREYELADCELQPDPSDPTLTLCATVFWSARDCNFVVFKVAEQQYRCQFFLWWARTIRYWTEAIQRSRSICDNPRKHKPTMKKNGRGYDQA